MNSLYLYNNIKNPLDNPNVMSDIIDAYSKSANLETALLRVNSEQKEVKNNQEEVDKLHSTLFNSWKNSILTLKPNEIKTAISRGIYDKSIYKLYDFLRVTPNVSTASEATKILTADYNDPELLQAVEKYRWNNTSTFKETIINAKDVYAQKFPSQKPEHILYINSANYDTHRLANAFIEKCTNMNLPYYFKLSENENCDNKITIYSDTEKLPQFINVLREIEKENPEIIKRCGQPPILSGQITNWLGYGNAQVDIKGKDDFHAERSNVIKESIDEELRLWYKENKDQIDIKDKKKKAITLTEYLSLQICRDEIEKMIKCLPKADFEKESNIENYGYTEEALDNPEFKKYLYSIVTEKVTEIIESYSNGRSITTDINIPFSNGKSHTISKFRILDEIRKSVKMVTTVDPRFISKAKKRIVENSRKKGIDSEKACFKKNSVQERKNVSSPTKELRDQQEKIKGMATQYGCKQPRNPLPNESVQDYSKYLKAYCLNILRPGMVKKSQATSNQQEPKQSVNKKQAQPAYVYSKMTDEEIAESRKKLGFDDAPQVKVTSSEKPKQKDKAQIYVYIPMTPQEIIASQQKIGEYCPPKIKKK